MANNLLTRACGLVTAYELPVILAVSPALLFPTPERLLVLGVVPVLWFAAWVTTGRLVPSTPLNATLWLLLVMVGVSLWATFDISFSLGKVSGVVLGVLLYWAVARWVTTAARLRLALAAYVLAGAGLAVVGLLGTNWFDKFPILGAVIDLLPKAIRGIPGAVEGFHPNAVAGCLVLFVPLQVALLGSRAARSWTSGLSGRWAARSFVGSQMVCLALTAGTLVLTQSRGALVGIAVAIGAFLLAYNRWTRVVAVLGVAAFVALVVALGPERVGELAISRSGPGMAGNVSGRVELWSRAIYGIQDFPVTGMGMNAFRKVMPVLYPTFLSPPDFDVAHAHNHLLQAGLDLGIPGLVAYGALWLLLTVLLARVYRSTQDASGRVVAGGLGAGLLAHFVFGMTDAIPLGAKVGVLFWLTVALAASLNKVRTAA